MAKDMRHYAKFTLDFPTNPKIMPLSDAAFRCLVEATIWSRLHQTDGRVPRAVALAQAPAGVWLELCTNDPDSPSVFETPEAFILHDFAEHQDTKAEIRARLQHAKDAGRRGGQASAQARAQAKRKRTLKQVLKQNPTRERESSSSPYGLEQRTRRASPNGRGATHSDTDEAIRVCRLCDDRGYVGLRAGPFVTCPHNPQQIEELENQYENVDAE